MINSLDMDGERYLPWMPLNKWGTIHYDHLGRYYFVEQIASAKTILDIASGEGYGASLLAKTANKVIGIDISTKAIEFAKNKYIESNLEFLQGNACKIPLTGQCIFDIICSFETLEHIDEKEQILMLNEFGRLIKGDGLLIISTPNYEYTHSVGIDNPYHKKELTFDEFDQLLSKTFPYRIFYGQKSYYQNQIAKLNVYEGMYKETVLAVDGESLVKAISNQKIPQNYICVASKSNISSELASGLITDAHDSIINGLYFQIAEIQTNLSNANAEIISLQEENNTLQTNLIDLYKSTSWKITKPMRLLKRFITQSK